MNDWRNKDGLFKEIFVNCQLKVYLKNPECQYFTKLSTSSIIEKNIYLNIFVVCVTLFHQFSYKDNCFDFHTSLCRQFIITIELCEMYKIYKKLISPNKVK